MPNTIKINAKEIMTLCKGTFETASTVRIKLYTIQGCLPISVVIQPHQSAIKPSGADKTAACKNHFVLNKRCLIRKYKAIMASNRINKPMPTIKRKLKNTG